MRRQSEKKFRLTITWKLAFFVLIALALAVSAREILSMAGVDNLYSRVTLSALTVVALLILFMVIIRHVIVKPLQSITETWRALAEGNPTQTFTVKSHDEIGDVARSCRLVTGRMQEV